MKIAIISVYCWESSFPLIKHIAEEGEDAHFFGLLAHHYQSGYVIDFLNNKQPFGFIKDDVVNNAINDSLKGYLAEINKKFFVLPGGGRRNYFADFIYAYRLAHYLKKQKYDIIHLIHTNQRFWHFLLMFLKGQTIIQTLHEVTAHEGETSFYTRKILLRLKKWEIPLIFHSQTSYKRFLNFCNGNNSSNNSSIIRFGLFETYLCFNSPIEIFRKKEHINILHFGRIVPYKGIHYLIDAVKILQKKYRVHLIIAGNGNPYFDFEGIDSFDFLNKTLSNEEIVSLIKSSNMVVLPYSSGSQSGIPMTVFPFCIPIIASNIAGFTEVIDHKKTGMLVDNLNAINLALSIEELLKSDDLTSNMKCNIKSKYSQGEFSWQFIAKKTIEFYKSNLKP